MADTKDLPRSEPTGRVGSVAVDIDVDQDTAKKRCCFRQRDVGKDMSGITHNFETKDTFLYGLFRSIEKITNLDRSEEIAEKITTYVWNQYLMGGVCVLTFAWYFPAIIFELSDVSFTFYVIQIIYFSLFFVYFGFVLLTVNRKAFWILIWTFDLWIKLYAAIKIIVASFLYYPWVESELYSERSYDIIYMFRINSLLVVILFSLVDGFNVSWKKFLVFGVILSTLFSITAVRLTFDDRPDRALSFSEGHSLSMVSQIASADRLLSIFLWKQTIKMGWKKGKTSIGIKHSATIQWDNDDDDDKYPIEMPMSSGSENV